MTRDFLFLSRAFSNSNTTSRKAQKQQQPHQWQPRFWESDLGGSWMKMVRSKPWATFPQHC